MTAVLRSLIRERIARGTMPENLEQLVNRRGTLTGAAEDLSRFIGVPVSDCLSAICEVYGCSEFSGGLQQSP
jgi:hypothetical protein